MSYLIIGKATEYLPHMSRNPKAWEHHQHYQMTMSLSIPYSMKIKLISHPYRKNWVNPTMVEELLEFTNNRKYRSINPDHDRSFKLLDSTQAISGVCNNACLY